MDPDKKPTVKAGYPPLPPKLLRLWNRLVRQRKPFFNHLGWCADAKWALLAHLSKAETICCLAMAHQYLRHPVYKVLWTDRPGRPYRERRDGLYECVQERYSGAGLAEFARQLPQETRGQVLQRLVRWHMADVKSENPAATSQHQWAELAAGLLAETDGDCQQTILGTALDKADRPVADLYLDPVFSGLWRRVFDQELSINPQILYSASWGKAFAGLFPELQPKLRQRIVRFGGDIRGFCSTGRIAGEEWERDTVPYLGDHFMAWLQDEPTALEGLVHGTLLRWIPVLVSHRACQPLIPRLKDLVWDRTVAREC